MKKEKKLYEKPRLKAVKMLEASGTITVCCKGSGTATCAAGQAGYIAKGNINNKTTS